VGILIFANQGPPHRSDVVASCDMRGYEEICMDLTSVNAKVEVICSKYTLTKAPCERRGAVGGCGTPNIITWYYPSSKVSTASDVKKKCTNDTFVDTSWE
jgi:hypothetical protein